MKTKVAKGKKSKKTKRNAGKGRSAEAPPELLGPAAAASFDLTPQQLSAEVSVFDSPHLLETSRTRWQYGDWQALTAISNKEIESHPDRARLALLVGAAHSHQGDMGMAKAFLRAARQWGCSRETVARVLASMVHNSLGRLAASLDNEAATEKHFESAIRLIEPSADVPLLARTRRVQETTRMGLLPDAQRLLRADSDSAIRRPLDNEARANAMRTEIDLLGHELSLSLQRRQLGRSETAEDIRSRSVSQLGQDLWVLERTAHKRGGFFVEFGATDGVRLSNTYLLETEFDWTGICAEPNPTLFEQLRKNRRCITSSACIGGVSGQELDFILADAFGGLADYAHGDQHAERRDNFRKSGHTMRVTTVSLHDFLTAHKAPAEIDYLSIDTEGSEYEILRNFPFHRWRIRLMTVEHNRTPMREQIKVLLEGLGYRRREVQFDDWYELEDWKGPTS